MYADPCVVLYLLTDKPIVIKRELAFSGDRESEGRQSENQHFFTNPVYVLGRTFDPPASHNWSADLDKTDAIDCWQ